MHGDVALVEVRKDGFGQRARRLLDLTVSWRHWLFGDQNRHAGALWLVILAGDVEYVCANDVYNIGQNLCKPLGVVFFIDVLHICLLVFRRLGIADVVDVEAQGLGQVVEPVKLEFAFHHWNHSLVGAHARRTPKHLRRTVNNTSSRR